MDVPDPTQAGAAAGLVVARKRGHIPASSKCRETQHHVTRFRLKPHRERGQCGRMNGGIISLKRTKSSRFVTSAHGPGSREEISHRVRRYEEEPTSFTKMAEEPIKLGFNAFIQSEDDLAVRNVHISFACSVMC
jgi:hypothetical protein